MNNSIDIIKSIYKPYKYTIKGKVLIIESTSGTFVIKNKENNLDELFSYLKSRSFINFPSLVDSSRRDVNVFEYLIDIDNPLEMRANDLIKLVANLHNKTSYYKDVREDSFKKIYDDIINNVNYLDDLYNKYYDTFFEEEMMSPSSYLFMRNYSKIIGGLSFVREEVNNWYDMVRDSNKTRVVLVHNNLAMDHFIKNDNDYLISWEKSVIDTPILDIVNLYKKEFYNYDFSSLIDTYNNHFKLLDSEMKLLFIMISIPMEIVFTDDEFLNTKRVSNMLDYIYKTEELIRPYYSKDKVE